MRITVGQRIALVVALLVSCTPSALAQGIVMPLPRVFFTDNTGAAPCGGCLLFAYAAGTTTKQSMYTTQALSVTTTNPLALSSAGQAAVYLDPALSYKFVLAPSTDTDPPTAAYWTQDNVVGPLNGVVTIAAADSRGFRITRASADGGMSIASSGGSGKTYGLVSTTTGQFQIRDDSDGTPRLALVGEDIQAQFASGSPPSFRILNGLLNVTGPGQHTIEASEPSGGNVLTVRNTSAGTGAYGGFNLGNDTGGSALGMFALASNWTTSGIYTQNSGHIGSVVSGGLTLATTHASGDIRFATADTNRHIMTENGRVGFGIGNASVASDMELRSTADGVSGGLQITRSDGTYFVFNLDDGGSSAFGTLQAGDGSAYRPTRLSPLGGGIQVGASGSTILGAYTGTATYDAPSLATGAGTTTNVTVTGATSASVCFAGLTTLGTNQMTLTVSPGTNLGTVTLFNASAGTLDLTSGTLRVTCLNH